MKNQSVKSHTSEYRTVAGTQTIAETQIELPTVRSPRTTEQSQRVEGGC